MFSVSIWTSIYLVKSQDWASDNGAQLQFHPVVVASDDVGGNGVAQDSPWFLAPKTHPGRFTSSAWDPLTCHRRRSHHRCCPHHWRHRAQCCQRCKDFKDWMKEEMVQLCSTTITFMLYHMRSPVHPSCSETGSETALSSWNLSISGHPTLPTSHLPIPLTTSGSSQPHPSILGIIPCWPGLPHQDAPPRVGRAAQLDVRWLIQRHCDAGGGGREDRRLGGTGNHGKSLGLGLVNVSKFGWGKHKGLYRFLGTCSEVSKC